METIELLKQALEVFRSGDLVLAKDLCQTVQGKTAGEPGSLRLLGQIAYMEGNPEEAADLFEKSLTAKPDQYSIWIKLGNIQAELGREAEAEKAYSEALSHSPEPYLAYLSRAQIRNAAGRKTEAFEDLDKAAEINPGAGQTYRLMALQGHPAVKTPAWRENLEHRLASRLFAPEDAIQAHYALGACCEADSDKNRMWYHYNQANSLQKNRAPEWREGYETLLAKSREVFSKEPPTGAVPEKAKKITPVFIVGLPRSGSTLLEKMLASHPKIAGGGETPFLPQVIGKIQDETLLAFPEGLDMLDDGTFSALSAAYQADLGTRAGNKPFATDKLLSNAFFLGLPHILTPWAKFIHVVRDPADTAFSIFKNYFWEQQTPEFCSLSDIGDYAGLMDAAMAHWKTLFPDSILEVRYEDLVANPEPELKRILEFLGLPWDAKCLNYQDTKTGSQTLSQDQARKALYTSSIGAAKSFATEMKPFFEAYKKA